MSAPASNTAATPAASTPAAAAPSGAASSSSSAAAADVAASKPDDSAAAGEEPQEEEEDEEEEDDPNAPVPNPLSDEDSEDEEGANGAVGGTDVRLGFLEEPEHPALLLRSHFPSKAGGRAAWLNPRVLPSSKALQCVHCSNPLVFLLQLYAPLRSTHGQSADTFHRTLYLFCCLEKSCENKQRSVVCLRSQLPLDNPFYPSEPLERPEPLDLPDDAPMPVWCDAAEPGVHLCVVCGNPAPSSCAKCHQRCYCSRLHQLWDWKQGGHKSRCDALAAAASAASSAAAGDSSATAEPLPSLLFPQKEVVVEPEYPDSDDDDELDEATRAARAKETPVERQARKEAAVAAAIKKSKAVLTPTEARLLADYEKAKAADAAAGIKDDEEEGDDEEDVASTAANWASPKLKDPLFTRFKDRVAAEPEQVLRYDRAPGADAKGFQPLWVSTWNQPASPPMPELPKRDPNSKAPPPPMPRPVAPTAAANDAVVPPCQRCGAARRFEFQVLPQLLYYLGPNAGAAMDFATVVVYTCSNSCGDGVKDGYFEEFTWVQAHAQ